jgi:hypothetical protein
MSDGDVIAMCLDEHANWLETGDIKWSGIERPDLARPMEIAQRAFVYRLRHMSSGWRKARLSTGGVTR